jgi:hypothetical protein
MKTTTKKKLMAIFDKYFEVAYAQLRLKGQKPDLENIVIEMINMHHKRINPLDYSCSHGEYHPAQPCKIKPKKTK